jgi:hypothetical protein
VEIIGLGEFFKWVNSLGNNVSLWGIMHWMDMINQDNKFDGVEKMKLLSSYLVISEKISIPAIQI